MTPSRVEGGAPHRRWVLWRLVPAGVVVGVLNGAIFTVGWMADVGDAWSVEGLRHLGELVYLSGTVAAPISAFVGLVSAFLLAEYLFQLLGEQDSVDWAIGRIIRRATTASLVLVPGGLLVVSLPAGRLGLTVAGPGGTSPDVVAVHPGAGLPPDGTPARCRTAASPEGPLNGRVDVDLRRPATDGVSAQAQRPTASSSRILLPLHRRSAGQSALR